MSVLLSATISWLIGLSVLLALPSAAIAGKQHCRTIELTGAAGPASADIVDMQVTDYLGNILDRSCKVTVQADECADTLAQRLVSQWGNGSEDLSQVGCATDLGDKTCGKNLDMDTCIVTPLDPICTVFCKHKYKKGKVKGGKSAIEELAMLGQCPAAPPNGEKADRGEFKKFAKIEICCFEAKDDGVLADPNSFDYTDTAHCKGKPLGKTLTSPQRIEISLFDRIDRPNVIGDGIFFDPKLPDNSLDVPVGISSRQISLDPIGFIQRPGTDLLDCRADIMKGTDSLIRTTVGVLTRCHAEVMAGNATADCNTVNAQSDPAGRVAGAAQILRELAIADCEGPDLASEGPRTSPSVYGLRSCPAPCDFIDVGVCSFGLFGNSCLSDRNCDTSPGAADGKCGSWSDATDCSVCLVQDAVRTAVADLYGSPGPGSGTAPDVVKCLNALGGSLEFLAKVNGTETLGCQKKADRAKVALPENVPYCKDADLKGNRNKAYSKAGAAADKSCAGVDIASLSICGGAASTDLATCLRANAIRVNDSLARAALPEQIDLCGNDSVDPGEECDGTDGLCPGNCLPDCTCPTCPTAVDIRLRAGTGTSATTGTSTEIGWTGEAHGEDWPDDYIVSLDLDCPGSPGACGQCSVGPATGPQSRDYLRCANDVSVRCTTLFDNDPVCGGQMCVPLIAPPIPRSTANNPLCSLVPLTSNVAGTMDPDVGSASLTVDAREIIHLGVGVLQPCPICVGDSFAHDGIPAGTCEGGPRDGQACDTQAFDATFAPAPQGEGLSLDCPPNPASNISGTGIPLRMNLSTGSSSLAAGVPCDPPLDVLNCPCAVCTNDVNLPCTQDADCPPGGTCTTNGGGQAAPRRPNACSDLTCSSAGPVQGECQAGVAGSDVLSFCDGQVRANGRGLIACASNAECSAVTCGGSAGCGQCTISENRPCFLDPITVAGLADPANPILSANTCLVGSLNSAINGVRGLPGPARLRFDVETSYR